MPRRSQSNSFQIDVPKSVTDIPNTSVNPAVKQRTSNVFSPEQIVSHFNKPGPINAKRIKAANEFIHGEQAAQDSVLIHARYAHIKAEKSLSTFKAKWLPELW